MPFTRPIDTIDAMVAEHINQFAKAWEGDVGEGEPMSLVINDAARYTQVVKQLDSANGQIATFRRHDDVAILTLTKNGATISLSTAGGASASPANALVGGAASQGTSQLPSRADHVHRVDPISAAGLADNAATQFSTLAVTAPASTTSTTNVGMPHDGTNQLSIAYTTSGLTGSWVELDFSVAVGHTAANGRTVFSYQVDSGGIADVIYPAAPSGLQVFASFKIPLPGLSAGSHLFRIWWRVLDAGTATVVAAGSRLTVTEHKR